jgi:hypothetical protein
VNWKEMWKKVVVAKFEALSWHLPGGTIENNQILALIKIDT